MASSNMFTDDILLEIFVYLPLNSIYKFKCLSKVWSFNLSNPNFIIKWFRINNRSLPLIQYYAITPPQDSAEKQNPLRFRKAYNELHTEFMSRNEYLFSFKFLVNQKPFQGAEVYMLGTSNGLVLFVSIHHHSQVTGTDIHQRYYVCNPLTQKWVSLPSPPGSPVSGFDVSGIFCEDSTSFASCYKVVRIPRIYSPSKQSNVDIFCSDLGVWESFQVYCDKIVVGRICGWCNFNKVVIIDGVLFWLEGWDTMLIYNLNQNNGSDGHRCTLINLPAAADDDDYNSYDTILGESEGWVCYAKTRRTGRELTVSVWVLDEVNWKILHNDVSVNNILAEMHSQIREDAPFEVLGFSPVDRNVILLSSKNWVREFNIETRSFADLCLDNRHVYHAGVTFLPFVLQPMPTVLPPPSWINTRD
ncbi:putative F-box/kelch-repeat protein At4g22430 [Papaver somniferum]|uniref:putative F-box/kelch-repeat protein At4g22430 n=1 Tax=Papaver somniferum TaxID=3469 RepID=UPI000E6F7DAD|nr:putative F-box/kelch-repeat protein At4g22430 [Papaver somniferum]